MVRTLTGEGVPNITQPTAEYPYGKYKDKTSSSTNDGTELSERTLGDCYQGMLNTITGAGITPNNEPERKGDSQFQKAVELLKPVAVVVVGSNDSGATYQVLASKIRDQAVTVTADFFPMGTSERYVFTANLCIKRNNSVDTSRRYIVSGSPAFNGSEVLPTIPHIVFVHKPYFDNKAPYAGLEEQANFFYQYPAEVTPENAKKLSCAVVTIYDAGAAS